MLAPSLYEHEAVNDTNSTAKTEEENNFITKSTVTVTLPLNMKMGIGHVPKLARDTEKGKKNVSWLTSRDKYRILSART